MSVQLGDSATLAPVRTGRFGRVPPILLLVSTTILSAVVVIAITGDLFAPHDPAAQNALLSSQPPGSGHSLGTDQLGRDVTSMLVAGARAAVVGPLIVAILTTLTGVVLGMWAGYRGGWIDATIARTADLLYSLPALLIAIVVVGLVSPSYVVMILVLAFLTFPGDVRIIRSVTMVEVRQPYVDAARTLGLSGPRILRRHVLPNIMPTVVSSFLLDFASALVGFSALAFLGLGVAPGSADWGTMVADGQSLLLVNPAMSMAPAVLLIAVTASATIVGDWLFDRYSSRGEQ
ncbi:ABC transporter permease [Nocardioides sp.]|uniref:ABC transporter permease n=1 Tax=Nocardioides sp. TaxID=35761 RepID=UPI003D128E1C